jgi:hypothetical protein
VKNRPNEMYLYEWSVLAWNTSSTRLRLDATGRGIYRELLDQCYTQGSIPSDPELICRICSCTMAEFERYWPLMSAKFLKDKKDDSQLTNKRADAARSDYFRYCKEQKRRRVEYVKKRGLAKSNGTNEEQNGGHNAKQPNTSQIRVRYESELDTNTNIEPPPEIVRERKPVAIRASDQQAPHSERWTEFLEKYPLKVELDDAARQFLSLVTTANEPAVFECLDRYLQSDQVARAVIMKPAKWLYEQNRSGWKSDWPRAPGKQAPAATQERAEIIRMAKELGAKREAREQRRSQ